MSRLRQTRGGHWARSNFEMSTKGSNVHVGSTPRCKFIRERWIGEKGVAYALFLDCSYSCSSVCILCTVHRWRKVTLTTKILYQIQDGINEFQGWIIRITTSDIITFRPSFNGTHCLLSSSPKKKNEHRSQRVIYIWGEAWHLSKSPFLSWAE